MNVTPPTTRRKRTSWDLINENTVQLSYKAAERFIVQNATVHVVIAAFTTCYARLLLLKYMDQVDEYCTLVSRMRCYGTRISFSIFSFI